MRMSPIIVRPVRTYCGWNPRVQNDADLEAKAWLIRARPAWVFIDSGAMHISQPGISINGGGMSSGSRQKIHGDGRPSDNIQKGLRKSPEKMQTPSFEYYLFPSGWGKPYLYIAVPFSCMFNLGKTLLACWFIHHPIHNKSGESLILLTYSNEIENYHSVESEKFRRARKVSSVRW